MFNQFKKTFWGKTLAVTIGVTLCSANLSAQVAHGQTIHLPSPGLMVNVTSAYQPVLMEGVTIDKENPFQFDFIIHAGDSGLDESSLQDESKKLIKYFLASLTIPEKDIWVNLSPYEGDRITASSFG
ncbi:MAG: hypothetical protein KC713_08990, partial [Candidatus Omnitrophica bacterium]|nr:hypothetical protein [Candidatus Omnitrophota bacterium]